jgi:hypothetical protein
MRADDLHHKKLRELDPEGGVIRFARQGLCLVYAPCEDHRGTYQGSDWQARRQQGHGKEGRGQIERRRKEGAV